MATLGTGRTARPRGAAPERSARRAAKGERSVAAGGLVLALVLMLLGLVVIAALGCGDAPASALASELRILHAFDGGDGAWSRGSLVRDGRALYGRTSLGGAHGSGTVFRIDGDGGGFAVLHSFTAGGDNGTGNQPHHNAMLFDGSRLVGAALYGGSTLDAAHHHSHFWAAGTTAIPFSVPTAPTYPKTGNGTLFSIGTDGASYAVLLELGGAGAPAAPHSPPHLVGSTLYGMTANGGTHGRGTLYAIPAGGAAEVLHSFHPSSGDEPHGVVVLDSSGQRLLGMTRKGGTLPPGASGSEAKGVVFALDLATRGYDVLHVFADGDPANGATNDHGFLTLVDGTAYATTEVGGAYGQGTVFAIGEDGSGFRIVHSFAGGSADGESPFGSLVPIGGWLYGTTTQGGATGDGTLFRLRPPDGPLEILASFDRATTGAFPEDNVVLDPSGAWLVGLTQSGGANDPDASLYYGTVFAFPLPPGT